MEIAELIEAMNELNKKDVKELKKIKKGYRDMVTRNLRKLAKAGIKSTPATTALENKIKAGKVAPIRQLTATTEKYPKAPKKKLLVREIIAYMEFQSDLTSRVRGFRQFESDIDARLDGLYSQMTDDDKDQMWDLYTDKETTIKSHELDSNQIQKELSTYFVQNSGKVTIDDLRQRMDDIMKNQIKKKYASPFVGTT
jgi:hypothetical protein